MKIRTLLVPAVVVTGLVLLGAVGWPLLSNRLARSMEDRLARETGRPWRIGSLGFDTAPALILDDVASEDGRARLTIRRMKVSGPVALLTGEAGTAHVLAEGLALRAPLDSAPAAARAGTGAEATRAATGIASVNALLRGAAWSLSDDGRTLSASASSSDVDVDLGPDRGGTAVKVGVEMAGHVVRLELDRPGSKAAQGLRLDLDPIAAPGHTARLRATLQRDGFAYRVDDIAGTLDQTPVSGSARLVTDGRPSLTTDLRLDALTLSAETPAARPAGGEGSLTVPVPTDVLPDPKWFDPFDLQARLAIARLTLGPARLDGVAVTATARQGVLEASMSAAPVYEGGLKARYALSPSREGPRHRLSLSLSGNRVRPLLGDLVDARGIDGRATGRIDIQVTGARSGDLTRSATGFADFSVVEGRLSGSAIAQWAGGGLGQQGGQDSLTTRFTLLGGSFSIAEGRASTTDLQLKSPLIEATGTGVVDLSGRSLDLTFQPSVAAQGSRKGSPGRSLNVPIRVSGAWEDPSVSADMSGLLQNPAGAVQAIQDLGSGLLGPDGGGLGDLLDGILPKSKPAAPAPRRR